MIATSHVVNARHDPSITFTDGSLEPAGAMSIVRSTATPETHESPGNFPATTGCGIILLDSQDKLTVFNQAAARILQLGSSAKTIQALPDQLKVLITEARNRRQTIVDRSIDSGANSKGRLNLLVSVLPMGTNETPAPVTVVLQDLAAVEQLQTSLQQLDRLANFGTLAAGVAHEIKNALVVGKTFFDLLLEKNTDSQLVQLVRRELKRVESLVTQMVRYNTPAKPVFSEINLHEVIDHSLLMLERQFKDKSIELNRDYLAKSDRLQGDDFQLEQAFVNLFLNAVEAMPPHGKLKVQTQFINGAAAPKSTGQLRVAVEDTGIGIPKENIDRLFTPFFTTKPSGTGLGLSITRNIVEQHGGTIRASSKQGSGTCFEIVLPAIPSS
jgi:signal transduction histidine kinase